MKNYVVKSRGFAGAKGALTWCDGTSGRTGTVDATNSLVGVNAGQSIIDGNNQLVALTNGNYVIGVANWQSGANQSVGAIIWGDGSTAGTRLVGTTDAANKIAGGSANDSVPSFLLALPNGNCVATSQSFNGARGAATWINGTNGHDVTGGFNPVSAANSLVGSTAQDRVGNGQTVILPSGNYLIESANWHGGFTDAGAQTFCKSDGTTVGAVGSGNSLVGSHNNDHIGQTQYVIVLPSGNYVVGHNTWNSNAGAVTWGSGTTGVKGVVDATNSIVGGAQDAVGTFSVAASGSGTAFNDNPRVLSSGDFVLLTSNFHSGGPAVGAATFVYGATGQTLNASNAITAANSIIGGATFSSLGSAEDLANGNLLVSFNGDGPGRVRLFTGVGVPSSLFYADQSSASVAMPPSVVATAIGNGTNVVLQANTDLTVTDPILVAGAGAGTLTLQAGRSILINANITTNNGPLNLTANDVIAAGVVDAQRVAGAGVITMAAATTIDTGTGVLTAKVLDGAGKTNTTSGPMTLETVKAKGGLLQNSGNTAGSNIAVTSLQITGNMTAAAPTVTLKTLDLAKNKLTVTGNLAFAASGQFITDIAGTGAGQLGQVDVTGTVNLNSATLNAILSGGFMPAPLTVIPLVVNDGSGDAIAGTFSGLAEDAPVSVSGQNFTVKYTGGAGGDNDAVLVKAPPVPPTVAGQLIITEFRLRGPSGANDEFVEIYNPTASDVTVQAADASAGLALAASDGTARFVIPNGTVIPAHGHYLGVNSVAYSLGGYAAGDITYVTDIPDNAGIALFNNSTGGGSFSVANRLDAVGSTAEANVIYKEGTGYPALVPFSIDYSFYRKHTTSDSVSDQTIALTDGEPRDTDNNAADFTFVDTNGTSAGAGQRLGSPGPQNLASPIAGYHITPNIGQTLVDGGAAVGASPNYIRDLTSVPAQNSTFGTVEFNRTFTNNTGVPLTKLRFRVVKQGTFPATSGNADLRSRTSADGVVVTTGGNVNVLGTVLEQPPSQPNGGAFNGTFLVPSVTLGTPLAPGASVNVRFLFGVQQIGNYCVGFLVEGLPSASHFWFVKGGTEVADVQTEEFSTPAPTVTMNTSNLLISATSMTIDGTNFSTTPANNVVTFSGGATGTVTAATATQLTVSNLSGLNYGPLTAVVTRTNDGISSGAPVQVATVVSPPIAAGDLVISEFRLRGPSGANDEFIEIYNTRTYPIFVQASDASAGFAVAASDGTARFTIPNGTIIPVHGHFLGTNSVAYSLAGHATGDVTYAIDIPDNAGIALFNNSTGGASFSGANRLDAVGSTAEANLLYKEGTGYPALTPFSIDYSFYRHHFTNAASTSIPDNTMSLADGEPQDTNNNAADFLFVDTNGTSAGAGQRLGAPGPENLASPISRYHLAPNLGQTLVDSGVAFSASPNRTRDFNSDPPNNSTFGTLKFIRTFTNNTGAPLTRLRFRVVKVTTFPAPSGTADLRTRTSADAVVVTTGGNVNVKGTIVEQPPTQANGGAWNSTFAVPSITPGTPLANGASVSVSFFFGIQQTGKVNFALLAEGLPNVSHFWFTSGDTDDATITLEDFSGNPNHAPVTPPILIERNSTQSVKVSVPVVLAQVTDVDVGDTKKLVALGAAAHGTVSMTGNGTTTGFVFYTPNSGWLTGDTFTYTVRDGHGLQSVGTVTVGIKVDNAPSTNISSLTMGGDGSVTIDFSGVPNRTYGLQFKIALSDPSWTNIGPVTANGFGAGHYVDGPPAHASSSGFYRLIYPAP